MRKGVRPANEKPQEEYLQIFLNKKVPGDTWSKMHEFPWIFAIQNIQTIAHFTASKYHGLPVQIKE